MGEEDGAGEQRPRGSGDERPDDGALINNSGKSLSQVPTLLLCRRRYDMFDLIVHRHTYKVG